MAGSRLARLIDIEYRTRLAFTKKSAGKCSLRVNMSCDKCMYKAICDRFKGCEASNG